jgi:outer membrane protein, heavy metal efflux system
MQSLIITALIALIALGVPATAAAQQQVHTESEIIAAARTGSAQLRAARAGAAASALGPAQVTRPNPMVEVMPMVAGLRDGEPGALLMARQALPWRARLDAERSARAYMADAGTLEADALELDVVAMARMAYAELWALQEQAERIRAFIRQLEQYRHAALAQYAAGRGPQQAVLGIQVEAGMLAQRLDALEEDRTAAAARLVTLTGGRVRVGDADRFAPPASAAARAPSPALREAEVQAHPMVAAGLAMQAAELSMAEMNRTMLRPEFTIGVNLNLSRMAFDRMYGAEPVMPAIGVMLPLQRSGVRARVQEAELRASQRELESADVRLRLESEAAALVDQITRVRQRIAMYEGTLRPLTGQTLEAGMAGYQSGTTRFLELLDAQRMALNVELDLIMARMREAELVARLDAATGRLPAPAPGDDARNDDRS